MIQKIREISLKDVEGIPSLTKNLLNEVDVEIYQPEMSVGQDKAHECKAKQIYCSQYQALCSASQ